MARSDQTSFLVEVLEGPAAGATIELNGRELPYRAGAGGSISFGKTQRTKLTWYPGNRIASQQIIGPVVAPTTVNGVWKERYIGEDRPIDLVELFEELLEQGAQLRVSWQTIERQGVVKTFTWAPGDPVGGLSDVRWEMVFEWNRADIPTFVPRLGVEDVSIRDSCVSAASALATLGDLVSNFVTGISTFVGLVSTSASAASQALGAVVDAFTPVIETETQVASQAGDEPELPARLVEDASSAAGGAQRSSGEAGELVATTFFGTTRVSDDLETVLNDQIEKAFVVDQSFAAAEAQFDLRVRLEALIRPEAFTSVVPIPGTDLRELAIRFYGNADLWRRIAKVNGLDGSLVPDDVTELVVPLSLPDATDEALGC